MPLGNRIFKSMLPFLLTSIYELWDSPSLQNKYVMSPENVWNAYPAPSVVVSLDGTGNFTSVQDAVDYVSSTSTTTHAVIDILPGTYSKRHREKVLIPKSKVSIMLRGSNPLNTIITYDDYAAKELANGYVLGTLWSCSVCVEANNFVAFNITFQNSAPPPPPLSIVTANGPMAVALRISGTMAAFYSCRFIGWQDTLYDHKGLHYFRDCYIEGNVDFVFGDATSVYEVTSLLIKCPVLHSGCLTMPSPAGMEWSEKGWYDWGDASRHNTTFFAMAQPFLSYSFIDACQWLGPLPQGAGNLTYQLGYRVWFDQVPPAPTFPYTCNSETPPTPPEPVVQPPSTAPNGSPVPPSPPPPVTVSGSVLLPPSLATLLRGYPPPPLQPQQRASSSLASPAPAG
ncbi:unnamed protein product [Closterium sp. Yama58-4]|nr:unnamed protein product [Closterium sp. Yama58-4]